MNNMTQERFIKYFNVPKKGQKGKDSKDYKIPNRPLNKNGIGH